MPTLDIRLILILLGIAVSVAIAVSYSRRAANRAARRAVRRFRTRVNRFKLTRKPEIRAALLADDQVAAAVREHKAEHGMTEQAVWNRVDRYIDEMVPHFNILAYYRIGYAASRVAINMLYKPTADYEDLEALERLPDDSIVVYLINHRSNADYVVVAYVLAGDVSISYAVGEWARAFPLEYVFKTFGSYFIRRRYRERLYHTVLERYVQLVTRHGVTQGIFPEGGLTRDGRLKPGKVGLLDYIVGVARDPAYAKRMVIVPVAINYDRVLEDRSLLRELASADGAAAIPRRRQAREVGSYLGRNVLRLLTGRLRRYGRVAVTIGRPLPIADWLEREHERMDVDIAAGESLWTLPRPERLARIQSLCDEVLSRIGALVPVTPVPLACAAIQSFDADWIPRDRLLRRMEEMRDHLVGLNASVVRADRDIEETFDRAWRMLRMRRILARTGNGYAVMSGQRELVSYYANSIAHLLGPFAEGLRERDALPMEKIG